MFSPQYTQTFGRVTEMLSDQWMMLRRWLTCWGELLLGEGKMRPIPQWESIKYTWRYVHVGANYLRTENDVACLLKIPNEKQRHSGVHDRKCYTKDRQLHNKLGIGSAKHKKWVSLPLSFRSLHVPKTKMDSNKMQIIKV